MIALFDLHGIAERARSSGNDRYLLNGSGLRLFRGDERMTYLMISDNALFAIGQYRVLFLIAGDNDLDALFEIGLRDGLSTFADGFQCRLVDNVR